MTLIPRYHHHRHRNKRLNGFAFDVTIRVNDETGNTIVTDRNNSGQRHVFKSTEEACAFIQTEIEEEENQ